MKQETVNSKIIKASAEALYGVFANPESLEAFMAPGEMKASIRDFDFKVGGGYHMSLAYPESDDTSKGKTTEKEDAYEAIYTELIPNKKISQVIRFASEDPGFSGDMTMEVTFEEVSGGTDVCFAFKNIPVGIKPEDNEEGTRLTLNKLADYIEGKKSE